MASNKLIELIEKSKLENKDQMIKFTKYLSESSVAAILKEIETDLSFLNFLSENLRNKLSAMQTGDKKKWDQILKDEHKFLQNLS